MPSNEDKSREPKSSKGKPRQVRNTIPLGKQDVAVYASPKIAKALAEVTEDMTIYHGVRLAQVMEAVYMQGLKDGARKAFGVIDGAVSKAKEVVPYRNPGKPSRKKAG
ncbi:MAG: hypothetical protein QM772_02175 [Ottowia sp.]|uniref:hypothetical protein n=1 Tax=Ottowia sp. TaxID=1898956 RepID=UPI0039E29711